MLCCLSISPPWGLVRQVWWTVFPTLVLLGGLQSVFVLVLYLLSFSPPVFLPHAGCMGMGTSPFIKIPPKILRPSEFYCLNVLKRKLFKVCKFTFIYNVLSEQCLFSCALGVASLLPRPLTFQSDFACAPLDWGYCVPLASWPLGSNFQPE